MATASKKSAKKSKPAKKTGRKSPHPKGRIYTPPSPHRKTQIAAWEAWQKNLKLEPKPTGAREVLTHNTNPLNAKVRIFTRDDPGSGGANHKYVIMTEARLGTIETPIDFQNGGVADVGVNGLSNEALLAIVQDRLEGFQSGPFAAPSNAEALYHVLQAADTLRARTEDRVQRGVEGTQQA